MQSVKGIVNYILASVLPLMISSPKEAAGLGRVALEVLV